MDKKHYNELILLSQRIHDTQAKILQEYLEQKYAEAGPESAPQRWRANL